MSNSWITIIHTPFAIRRDALDERQAVINHSQTLDRLNQRGGIAATEAWAISAKQPYGMHRDEKSAWEYLLSLKQATPAQETFQACVANWMAQCFLPSLYSNMTERGDRLLEEVLELLQAHGYDKSRVATLVDYVYGRPVGEPAQEVGGVMVTLAGFCWIAGIDMHDAGSAELTRITQPEVMAKIRAKQEAKNALHFDTPLPGHAGVAHD